MERLWWSIDIVGYGTFRYFGTEQEAEEMRSHKAKWEGNFGYKRPATVIEAGHARRDLFGDVHRNKPEFYVKLLKRAKRKRFLDQNDEREYAAYVDTFTVPKG